jgi:UrcA family protein
MMNHFVSSTASAATWALVALPFVALAGAVHAQGVTIQYGDLSSPTAAAAFEHKIDKAAFKFCDQRDGLARIEACRQAIREEAMSQLSPTQRMQVSMVKPAHPSAS